MATPKTKGELRRGSDLAVIRSAIACTCPEVAGAIGLADIARLCRRRAHCNSGLDWNERRDLILSIAVEWNLATRDTLDAQSDTCLRSIARFLGR